MFLSVVLFLFILRPLNYCCLRLKRLFLCYIRYAVLHCCLILVQVDLSEVLAVQMHRRMKEQQKAEQAIVQLQKGGSPEIQVFKKETR